MEGECWLGTSVTLGEFWSQKRDEVEHQGVSRSKAVLAPGEWLSLERNDLAQSFFLCMGLDSRRKHHLMIVFFSLFGSNFSSCCPDLAAPKKASYQDFGMALLQGGPGQGTVEGSSSPLLPLESEAILHCLSLSPLTHPHSQGC